MVLLRAKILGGVIMVWQQKPFVLRPPGSMKHARKKELIFCDEGGGSIEEGLEVVFDLVVFPSSPLLSHVTLRRNYLLLASLLQNAFPFMLLFWKYT